MTVHYRHRDQAAWIVLDRPEALNALDFDTLHALEGAFARAEHDPAVRVVVLTGRGRAFCAGGDIHQLRAEIEAPGHGRSYIEAVTLAFAAVRALGKPLVGCINGLAVGGGLELLLHCDLVVAADDARIGDGHVNFAIFPGGGSSALLPRRLPLNLAKRFLFTGDLWSAAECHRLGLVNEVVPPQALEETAQHLANQLAAKSPRLLRRLKALIDNTAEKSLATAFADELQELRDHMTSNDMREGTSAFVEKRTPHYTGT